MSPARATTVAAIAAVLVSGCASGEHRSSSEGQLSVTVKQVPLADYGLGPNDCFVATARAEVRLAGRSPQRGRLCRELAKQYLSHAGGLVWRPVRDEHDAPTLVCFVARGAAIVEVLSASYDTGRVNADEVCERLQRDHWERRSPLDAP